MGQPAAIARPWISLLTLGVLLNALGCASPVWESRECSHFTVLYEPESYAAAHLEQAISEYEQAFEFAVSVLPSGTSEWKFKLYLHSGLAEAGHANRSDRSVHYLYSERGRLTSAHEMMHHLLYELNPGMPLRFEEGVCRLFEMRSFTSREGTTSSCSLVQLAKLAPPGLLQASEVFQDRYRSDEEGNCAAAFAAYLLKRLGKDPFWEFYRQATPASVADQLPRLLKKPAKDLDSEVVAFVKGLEDPPAVFRFGK